MVASGEVNSWAAAVANTVAVTGRADFVLLNLDGSPLPAEVLLAVRRAAYSREDSSAAYVPAYIAREMGASLLSGPEVAEPGTRLASEADFLGFAASVMPERDDREVRKRAAPMWNDLRRAAGHIEIAREWLTLLPVLKDPPSTVHVGEKWRTPEDLQRLAAFPLRFVLPHDHEATGATERSLDLESLHHTLDTILAEGYPKAS